MKEVKCDTCRKEKFIRLTCITRSNGRIAEFKKLVEEKNLSTSDVVLILTTIGLNPDFYHYWRTPSEWEEGVQHKNYLPSEDIFMELCD